MYLRLCLLFFAFCHSCLALEPKLQLANQLKPHIELKHYFVSEKYDGFRAYWDGEKLLSRSGKTFAAPAWFIADFPKQALDGELWTQRQDFSRIASIVSKQQPIDAQWRQIKYMVFDLPNSKLGFAQRYQRLQSLLANQASWLRLVPQWRVNSRAELEQQLGEYTQLGAEGLMLQHQNNLYRQGRSNGLIKLKPLYDDEAIVLAHLPGKGKFTDLMGSLKVRNRAGKVFHLGTGFSLAQRRKPPPVGSIITYQFTGYTSKGLPRFARFLRLRQAYLFDKTSDRGFGD